MAKPAPVLERCPICGSSKVKPTSDVVKTYIGTYETLSQVWCSKCGACGPAVRGWEASLNGTHIEQWNSWAKWLPVARAEQEKAWRLQREAYDEWKARQNQSQHS